jgi:hypothetical protein
MASASWLSIGLGVATGLFHGLAGAAIVRIAARFAPQNFVKIYLGGMAGRLFVTLMLVVLLVLLAPLERTAYAVSFFLVFFAGLIVEVAWLHRRANAFLSNR